MNQDILTLSLRRVCESISYHEVSLNRSFAPFLVPFEGLADSSGVVSGVGGGGATILTAADRDCGLAKNAMHELSARRRRRLR